MTNLEIATLFKEDIGDIEYYNNTEVLSLKHKLQNLFQTQAKQLVFLIGDPGVGKSAFLKHAFKEFSENVISFDIPFIEPVDFVKTMIKKTDQPIENYSLEQLITQLIEIYKDSNYVVVIDEAQLLSNDMIEIIRILADSKAFWFVLAMHKHESKKILTQPQFASRPHQVFELGYLHVEEAQEYIYMLFQKHQLSHIAENINKKYLKHIYAITKGNFRNLKKILHTVFLLIDYAQKNNKTKYTQLSKCLFSMAAIESGLIDV